MHVWLSWIALGAVLLLVTLAYLQPGFMIELSNLVSLCF